MEDYWTLWWVWACAALGLAILEVLAPGFIFLGIAGGAAIMALITLLPFEMGLPLSLALFGILSMGSWWVLKRVFKPADDQTRIVHEDINK